MKMLSFLCCLAPDVANTKSDSKCAPRDGAGLPPSDAALQTTSVPQAPASERVMRSTGQPFHGGDTSARVHPRRDGNDHRAPLLGQEAKEPSGTAERATAPGPTGHPGLHSTRTAAAEHSAGRHFSGDMLLSGHQIDQRSPEPDYLSVARQGLQQLVMDLRFRPDEQLRLTSFCRPCKEDSGDDGAAGITDPLATSVNTASLEALSGLERSTARRPRTSSYGTAESPQTAAAAALQPVGSSASHRQTLLQRALGRRTGDGSTAGGGCAGCAAATTARSLAAGSSNGGSGGDGSGGTKRRSNSGSRRSSSGPNRGSIASTWALLQPLRPTAQVGGASLPGRSGARVAAPVEAVAAAATGCAAAAAEAASPPNSLTGSAAGRQTAAAAAATADAAAGAAASAADGETRARRRRASAGFVFSLQRASPTPPRPTFAAEAAASGAAQACGAATRIATQIGIHVEAAAQTSMAPLEGGCIGGIQGNGHDALRVAAEADQSRGRDHSRRRLSMVVTAGPAQTSAASLSAPAVLATAAEVVVDAELAVDGGDGGTAAGVLIVGVPSEESNSPGSISSIGSTGSVSFAGLGAGSWGGLAGDAGFGFGCLEGVNSDTAFGQPTPMLIPRNSVAAPDAAAADSSPAAVVAVLPPCCALSGGGGVTAAAASSGGIDAGSIAFSTTSLELTVSSSALRRSASVPAIYIRAELRDGAIGALGGASGAAVGTGAAGGDGDAARNRRASSRPVILRSFGMLCPPPPPPAGWRTPLAMLPAARHCGLGLTPIGAGMGTAVAVAPATVPAWRAVQGVQSAISRSGKPRSSGDRGGSGAVQCTIGGGGGSGGYGSSSSGAMSGLFASSGVLGVIGAEGMAAKQKGGPSGSYGGSGGGKGLPSPSPQVRGAAGETARPGSVAAAAVRPEFMPYSKTFLPPEQKMPLEMQELMWAHTAQRHPPYASKHMSQMALLPFLQHQSNSTALHVVYGSTPASFQLAALSREVSGLRWIGQGGGGAVFQGVWQGVPVAVKFLLTEAEDGREVEAAALEGVVSSVVHHPNVLHTYAFECTRLTEDSFNESEPPAGSGEEGGTELLESLMESCNTLSGSLNAARRARIFHCAAAGGAAAAAAVASGGGGGIAAGGGVGSVLQSTTRWQSRLGVPSLGELPALSVPSSLAVAVAYGSSGGISGSVPPRSSVASAVAVLSRADDAMTAAAAGSSAAMGSPVMAAITRGQSGSTNLYGRQRSGGLLGAKPAAAAAAAGGATAAGAVARSAAGEGGGAGCAVPRMLQSWLVDVPGPHGGHSGPGACPPTSPPRSPVAAPRGRSPLSRPRSPSGAAAAGADRCDMEVFVGGGGCGGGVVRDTRCEGGGGAAAAAAAGAPTPASGGVLYVFSNSGGCGGGGGGRVGGGLSAAAAPPPVKITSTFHSEDGFGDPEASMGAHCWTVRQVLSYLKAQPGMYMTHIIMEYCDRGSLLSAIKRGIFRTDSSWLEEEGSLGGVLCRGSGSGGGGSAAATGGGGAATMWTSATLCRVLAQQQQQQHKQHQQHPYQPQPHRGTAAALVAQPEALRGSAAASRRVVLRALLRTARDVAQGMCHLHANGIIHGDLKPGNVLLRGCRSDRRGFVAVVCDFGLSKVTRGDKPLELNHWSTVTVMAPEVIMGRWLKASDVFSFGILLWQLVTGDIMPYGTCTVPQILVGVSQGTLKPEWPASAHPALVRLGRACLATIPEKRPKFEAIVKMLTKIEKDVRSQLLQPPAGHTKKSPPPAAQQLAWQVAVMQSRPRGVQAAAAGPPPVTGGAGVAAGGSGGGLLKPLCTVGSSNDVREQASPAWSCRAGSPTFSRRIGDTSTRSTAGFKFGLGFAVAGAGAGACGRMARGGGGGGDDSTGDADGSATGDGTSGQGRASSRKLHFL